MSVARLRELLAIAEAGELGELGQWLSRLHGAALASSLGDTAQPGTKSCARADADGRHRCTGAFEPALSAPMIQHPTSLSCLVRRVLSHLLGRRASFTVPPSTVPTIDNPGADGVNTVQRGCATCDPTPGFRPTRRMNHVPVSTDRSPSTGHRPANYGEKSGEHCERLSGLKVPVVDVEPMAPVLDAQGAV